MFRSLHKKYGVPLPPQFAKGHHSTNSNIGNSGAESDTVDGAGNRSRGSSFASTNTTDLLVPGSAAVSGHDGVKSTIGSGGDAAKELPHSLALQQEAEERLETKVRRERY